MIFGFRGPLNMKDHQNLHLKNLTQMEYSLNNIWVRKGNNLLQFLFKSEIRYERRHKDAVNSSS